VAHRWWCPNMLGCSATSSSSCSPDATARWPSASAVCSAGGEPGYSCGTWPSLKGRRRARCRPGSGSSCPPRSKRLPTRAANSSWPGRSAGSATRNGTCASSTGRGHGRSVDPHVSYAGPSPAGWTAHVVHHRPVGFSRAQLHGLAPPGHGSRQAPLAGSPVYPVASGARFAPSHQSLRGVVPGGAARRRWCSGVRPRRRRRCGWPPAPGCGWW
jgi:hypothetical protein